MVVPGGCTHVCCFSQLRLSQISRNSTAAEYPVLSPASIRICCPISFMLIYPDSLLLQAKISTLLCIAGQLNPSPLSCTNVCISPVLCYKYRYLFSSLLQAYTFQPLLPSMCPLSTLLQACTSSLLPSYSRNMYAPIGPTAGIDRCLLSSLLQTLYFLSSPLQTPLCPVLSTAGMCIQSPLHCRHEHSFFVFGRCAFISMTVHCRKANPVLSTAAVHFLLCLLHKYISPILFPRPIYVSSLLQLHIHPFFFKAGTCTPPLYW